MEGERKVDREEGSTTVGGAAVAAIAGIKKIWHAFCLWHMKQFRKQFR